MKGEMGRVEWPDTSVGSIRKVCVLAFFSVVASYSNLSTFWLSGAKVGRKNFCTSLFNHKKLPLPANQPIYLMKKLFCICLLALTVLSVGAQQKNEFTVLQWNIWQEGTKVPGGYDAIVDEIVRLKPDVVTLSEVRNYNQTRFCDRILRSLREKGETYYSFFSYDSGLLSRYPITDSLAVYPEDSDHGSIHKMKSTIGGHPIAVYTAHLDYLDDAYYNVRGYDGSTWEEIPIPQSVAEVLTRNDASQRDDALRLFLADARKEVSRGTIVVLGGDFNEPSHLDWVRETKDLYDHHGLIIPWTVPLLLDNEGYIDTYRSLYPNVLTHPGFTYPADTPGAPIELLTWAPKADERERIDYIFYHPHPAVELKDAVIFGPEGCIVRSKRMTEKTQDRYLAPAGIWPTDHKGLLVTFRLK